MSVQLDVERFRSSLARVGYSTNEIQIIADEMTADINDMLLNIVSDAVSQAIDYALSLGADEFVDDVQVLPDSNGLFQISTHSGKTNYSRDRQEMLSRLLKNAKTSKDGHKYKVIPMPERSEPKAMGSMFDVLQTRQDAITSARTALKQQASNRKLGITEAIRINLAQQVSPYSMEEKNNDASSKKTTSEFRTASDKQDASVNWVIPEKDADMTIFLYDINARIITESFDYIKSIMSGYDHLYLETR